MPPGSVGMPALHLPCHFGPFLGVRLQPTNAGGRAGRSESFEGLFSWASMSKKSSTHLAIFQNAHGFDY
ncbi:hypothetical protein VTO42DRAFT_5994 [Malbranchea cinnamomea]